MSENKRPLISATTGAVVTPTKKEVHEVHDLTDVDDIAVPSSAVPSAASTTGSAAKKPPLSTRNPSEFKRTPIPKKKGLVTPNVQNTTPPHRLVVTQQLLQPLPPQPQPTSEEDDVWRHPEAYAYSQNERESISAYLPPPLISPDPHEVKEPARPIASVVETTTTSAPLPAPPPARPHPKFGAPATAGYSLGPPLEETLQPAISRATSDALASTASASPSTSATPMEIDSSSAEPIAVKPAGKRIKLVRPSLTPSVDSLPPRPPSPVKASDQPASTSTSTSSSTSKPAEEQPATASTSEHAASLSKPSKLKRAAEGEVQPAGVVIADSDKTPTIVSITNDAPQPPPQKKQKRGRKSAAASANANDPTLSSTTISQPTPPVPAAESTPAPPTTTASNPEERLADVYAKQLVSQRKSAAKVKLDILAGEISTVHHDPHRKQYLTGTKFHDDNLEIGDSSTVFSWTEYVQHLVSRLIQTNLQQQQEALIIHRASIGPHQRMNLRKLDDALTKERVERYEREQAADQEDDPTTVDGATDRRRGRKRQARSTTKEAKGAKTKSATATASTSPVKKKRRGRPKGTSAKKE